MIGRSSVKTRFHKTARTSLQHAFHRFEIGEGERIYGAVFVAQLVVVTDAETKIADGAAHLDTNRSPRRAECEQKTIAAFVDRARKSVGVEDTAVAGAAHVQHWGFSTGIHARLPAKPASSRRVSVQSLLKNQGVPHRVAIIL